MSGTIKKKEWNNAICSYVDVPRAYQTKWSKSERVRQTLYYITCMWNLKYDTGKHTYETETHYRLREKTCGCQEGAGVGEGRIGSLGLADAN